MSERSDGLPDGLPEFIDLERHGTRGRRKANVFRAVTLAAILVLLVLGLVNMFGQRPRHTEATGADATLDFGAIQPGATVTAYLQFQVNPTNVGRRPQGVTLADGERQLERVERTVTVFP